ncbi:MAG: hypothetical protein GXP48_02360 [Acidobacteria bacterium]|nr:hypothetical protein [Acidobacteriota bacterium]
MARALVLSGGGVKGTFEAGVVHRLAEAGHGGWSVYCGVSAGALNAFMAAQGRVEEMARLWVDQARRGMPAFRSKLDAANLAVHAIAPGLLAYADILATDGLYDNRELAEILEPFAAGLAGRLSSLGHALRVGVVCLQTGEYLAVDPAADVEAGSIVPLILASTAIPLAFDPVELVVNVAGATCSGRRCQFVDGGVRNITPLADAIRAAKQGGIELDGIDVVLASPLDPAGADHEFHGLLEIGLRAEEILTNEIYRNDLEMFIRANALAALHAGLASDAAESADAKRLARRLAAALPGSDAYRPLDLKIIRPTPDSWRAFTGRKDADVGLEFPGDLDRNAELLQLVHGYGRWLADHGEFHQMIPARPDH